MGDQKPIVFGKDSERLERVVNLPVRVFSLIAHTFFPFWIK
jgi:hypothetical protein